MDGATDKTEEIALNLAKSSEKIKVIVTENKGVSNARNVGLKEAQGEYVCFLDADDYYESEFIVEKFYNLCKQFDLDVIRGAYRIFNEEKGEFIEHNPPSFPKINQVISGQEFLKSSAIYRFNEVVPWLGLYKKEYLVKTNSFFPVGIAYEEDQLFFLNCLLNNGKFMQTDEYFYVYVKRDTGCTNNLTYKKAQDVAKIVESELNLIKKFNLKNPLKKYALKYVSASFYQLTSIYGRVDKSERKKCVSLVKFSTRIKLMFNAYSKYIAKKIFLFNFCRIILDKHYDKVKNG